MGHAILPVQFDVIAGSLLLPEQYKIISAQYDVFTRIINFVVESAELPEDLPDGQRLPTLVMRHTVETHPDDPTFRKVTGGAEVV